MPLKRLPVICPSRAWSKPPVQLVVLIEKRSFDWTSWIKREISLQKGNGYDKIFPQLTKKGLEGLDRSKT